MTGTATTGVTTACYSVCGTRVEVRATDEVAALIASRLGRWRSAEAVGPVEVSFEVRAGADEGFAARPAGSGRPVYEPPGGRLLYYEGPDQLFITYPGAVRMLCSPAEGTVQSALLGDGAGPVLAAYQLFTVPLMEMMKRRGRPPLHAGCVARRGRGLLLAGTSGCGKSTLTAALVRAGWDLVSDDTVFLRQAEEGGTRAWGLSGQVDLADRSAAMFAELSHLVGRLPGAGRDKHPVDAGEAFGASVVASCRPRALVLPALSGGRHSVLSPLPAPRALRQLVPDVLLTGPSATQAHLDALAALVREVDCYSLATGSDLDEAVDCLQGALG